MTTHHDLKILPKYYLAVADGRKTFEVRNNDRQFKFGDTVTLKEWLPDLGCGFTGRELSFRVGYIFEVDQETVVFSLLQLGDQ